jgi:simple sugar transport system substrate-binding protein
MSLGKLWPALLSAAALLGLALAAWAAEPLKIAFVYVGPVTDAGWTHQHDLGRRELEQALGAAIKTTVVESVPEGADAERVIRSLAQQGNRVIFTTSFGYMNPTLKVARQFPTVVFENATGYKRAKNVGTYSGRFYEGKYLNGVLAGKMTRSNVIGYVAAFPIPEVVGDIDAFVLGARSVNPGVKLRVIWTSAWFDPPKEREAADALVAQGADVLCHDTDSTAVMQAAESNGVYALAYNSDLAKYGPRAQLSGTIQLWGGYYIKTVKAVLEGKWKPEDTWGGIRDGMVGLAPLPAAVPREVAELIEAKRTALVAGKLAPFQGPIKDQGGRLRVPAGKRMSDKEILALDWYVEGIVGKLPR